MSQSDLGLDGDLLTVGLKPGNVHFNVKVTNIGKDGIVSHLHEVLWAQDVTATSGSDKDAGSLCSILHGGYFIACSRGEGRVMGSAASLPSYLPLQPAGH